MLKSIVIKRSCPKAQFLDLIPPRFCCSLINCSGAHFFCITFCYIFRCSVGELQANTGGVITYTLYLRVIHQKGETTSDGVEEKLDHKCFKMLLLMPAQGISPTANFFVSCGKATVFIFYEKWLNGMLVRVCSASAPAADSLYLGAAPNVPFRQKNPSQDTKGHEHGIGGTLC